MKVLRRLAVNLAFQLMVLGPVALLSDHWTIVRVLVVGLFVSAYAIVSYARGVKMGIEIAKANYQEGDL